MSNVTKGGVSARVNSSVLSLYDSERLQGPTKGGEKVKWSDVDSAVKAQLAKGGKVRVLTNSILSPSTKAAIAALGASLGEGADFEHVTYDAFSYSGMIEANEATFGKAIIPSYHFENAKTVVSFGADFLANWLSHVEYQHQFAIRRNPDGAWMSRHYQFESNFSLTGTNADIRGAIKPSEQAAAVAMLYNFVAEKVGQAKVNAGKLGSDDNEVAAKLKKAATDLVNSKGHSLVVANSNNKDIQVLVNGINNMLGAYGSTIDMDTNLNLKQARDSKFANLVKEMNSGSVNTLFVYGVNPVYSAPAALNFAGALKKVKFSVGFADRLEENSKSLYC